MPISGIELRMSFQAREAQNFLITFFSEKSDINSMLVKIKNVEGYLLNF